MAAEGFRTIKLYYGVDEDKCHVWYEKKDKNGDPSPYGFIASCDKRYTKEESFWLSVEGYAKWRKDGD